MSGHSKWKTIKHKKAATDAQKAKKYTKLIKDITVAARSGGGETANNPHLRMLLEKARKANMPQENAVRAVKKGTGELPGVQYETHHYEGYGPAGIAVIVDVLTDNKNRAVSEVRTVFTRKGGSLGETGSVNWMFERKGVVKCKGTTTEDALLEALFEYNIADISHDEDIWTITGDTSDLEAVKNTVQKMGLAIEDAEIEWVAKTDVEVPEDKQEQAVDFLSALEDLEDVQHVFTNLA